MRTFAEKPDATARRGGHDFDVKRVHVRGQAAPAASALESNPLHGRYGAAAIAVRAKGMMSEPGDPVEQEADRVADRVMRAAATDVRIGCASVGASCESKDKNAHTILRPSSTVTATPNAVAADSLRDLGAGQPLDQETRAVFEPRFGYDFSRVRVHTSVTASATARALNARAYTMGPNIVFGAGQFGPRSQSGGHLLAHELTHVIQQSSEADFGRAAGERATPIVLRQKATQQDRPGTAVNAAPHDAIVVWFDRDSDAMRNDPHTKELVADTIAAVRAHLSRHKDARIVIAGYASVEGDAEHNRLLSERRAWTVKRVLEAAGVPEEQLADVGRGADNTWPSPAQNRRVEIEVPVDTEARGARQQRHDKRPITDSEEALLDRLDRLAQFTGSGTHEAFEFALAVLAFEATLRRRIKAVDVGKPLPEDVRITLEALTLWANDDGRTWGHAAANRGVNLSAPQYAAVAGHMNKCNIYVAEILNRTVGTLQLIHASDRQIGKYFPYRAEEWGDTKTVIPEYPVVSVPRMGDVWSNGHHVGIYLGTYKGNRLYVSARNDTDGVWGLKGLQYEHGVQIKLMPEGGVLRRHVGSPTHVR